MPFPPSAPGTRLPDIPGARDQEEHDHVLDFAAIEEAVLNMLRPPPTRWSATAGDIRLRPGTSGYGRDHCWFLPPFCG
jgi:hypothetical protein